MSSLLISQAKPNPVGKDRLGSLAPPLQLAGEWVDIQNNTTTGIDLSNIELYHVAYTASHPEGEWEKVFNMSWVLPGGDNLRIHSGGRIPVNSMRYEDQSGADWHAFTGKNYVWNNSRSDTPLLFNTVTRTTIDKATYSANPLEGRVLQRIGDSLI
jgi:hypothetical protein